jgi:hypothetical protein
MSESDSLIPLATTQSREKLWRSLVLDETTQGNPIDSLQSECLPATYVSLREEKSPIKISHEADLSQGPILGQGGMGVVR